MQITKRINENNDFQKKKEDKTRVNEIGDFQNSKDESKLNYLKDPQDKSVNSNFLISIPNPKLFQVKRKSEFIKKLEKFSFLNSNSTKEEKLNFLDDLNQKLNLPNSLKSSRYSKLSHFDEQNHDQMITSSTMEFLNGKIFSQVNFDQKPIKKPSIKDLPKLKMLSLGIIIQVYAKNLLETEN